jgi:PD-(D/E)XK nuclease superfamily
MTDYRAILAADIARYAEESPRTQQSRKGTLGPSDIGFCRQKAALVTREIQPSDERSTAAAQIGTAVHAYLADVFTAYHPDWIIEADKVTATLPSGVEISGTPDIIATDWNAVIDIKTVDGFEWVKREGTSQNHKMQRHLYALGAVQAGLVKEDDLLVGNLYIDRSGREQEPYLTIEPFDPSLTDEIDSWIGDVIYAVKHGEDAARDIPAPVCEKICEFYTVCRGDLPVEEGGELIEDTLRIDAVRMFVDGRDLEKTGSAMKREAVAILSESNGIASVDGVRFQVRTTHVNPSRVEAFDKAGYTRLDVRKMKG